MAGVEFLRTKNNNLLRRPVANVASKYATMDIDNVRRLLTSSQAGSEASRSMRALHQERYFIETTSPNLR